MKEHSQDQQGTTSISTQIICIFIDVFLDKNRIQEQILHELNYEPYWFQTNYRQGAPQDERHFAITKKIISRYWFYLKFLIKHYTSIHHAEVYTGGRLVIFTILLLRLFRIKVICVERGEIFHYSSTRKTWLSALSWRLCYNLSHIIWYKEVYMKEILQQIAPKKRKVFIHNAVYLPESKSYTGEKDIQFLWVNRMLQERHPEWFSNALKEEALQKVNGVMLGFNSDPHGALQIEEYISSLAPNMKPYLYQNPSTFYPRARFFVLPAKMVFGNHALMEAMSYGLVPIVLESPGVELMVKHHVNGFICQDYKTFVQCLTQAYYLDENSYLQMSEYNKQIIRNEYSYDYLFSKIKYLYEMV